MRMTVNTIKANSFVLLSILKESSTDWHKTPGNLKHPRRADEFIAFTSFSVDATNAGKCTECNFLHQSKVRQQVEEKCLLHTHNLPFISISQKSYLHQKFRATCLYYLSSCTALVQARCTLTALRSKGWQSIYATTHCFTGLWLLQERSPETICLPSTWQITLSQGLMTERWQTWWKNSHYHT